MGLETATYISGLNASNPVHATDQVSQGDDHLRLIKSALLATFPNINAAVDLTPAEMNYLDGVTGVTGTGKLALSAAPTFTGLVTAGSFAGSIAATEIDSGILPSARIAAAAVTQHQAALSITESQVIDLGSYIEPGDDIASLTVTTLDIDAADCSLTRDGAGQIAVEGAAVFTHDDAALVSSKVFFSSGTEPTTEGSNGDLFLVY